MKRRCPSFDITILIRLCLGLTVALSMGYYLHYLKNNYASTRQQTILNTTRPDFEPLLKHLLTSTPLDDPAMTQQYIAYFTVATNFNPQDDTAHTLLYYLYTFEQKQDNAQAHAQKAFDLNPTSLITQYNYALVLMQQAEYKKALEVLQRGVNRTIQEEWHHLQSSMAYRQVFPSPKLWQYVAQGLAQLQQQRHALMIACAKNASSNIAMPTTSFKPRLF